MFWHSSLKLVPFMSYCYGGDVVSLYVVRERDHFGTT